MRHGCSPTARSLWHGSAQTREESGCGWHPLQLVEAKRSGGLSCRSEQDKLGMNPKTWAETQHLVAMVVRQSTFQTEKQKHRA